MAFASLVPGQLADRFKFLKAKSYCPPSSPALASPAAAGEKNCLGRPGVSSRAGAGGREGGIKPFIGFNDFSPSFISRSFISCPWSSVRSGTRQGP